MGYHEDYLERRKAEEKAERDYWLPRVHWAPFQGPDRLGRTLKCGEAGGELSRWTYTAPPELKPWKPDRKATKSSAAHVEMSQRVFWSSEGFRFTFWALAPTVPGIRSFSRSYGRRDAKNTEFVWLVLEGTNGRGVHHALVDKDSDVVYWFDRNASHYQETAA